MSRIFKATNVVLDNKKYKLADEIIISEDEVIEEKEKITENIVERTRRDTEEYMDKLVKEANEKIKLADEEYNNIIAKAYSDSKEIMDASKEEGYEEGRKKGYEDARLEMQDVIKNLNEEKIKILDEYRDLLKNAESDILNLVLEISKKIIGVTIDESDEYLNNIIKKGIEKTSFKGILTLKVSKEEYIKALIVKDEIVGEYEDVEDIIIKEDISLKKGGCIIETPYGSVDSGVWTQYEKLKIRFLELLGSE